MTTPVPSTDVAVVDPTLSDAERYALAAFLAGYRGVTRDAYALDLRQFMACHGFKRPGRWEALPLPAGPSSA